MIAVEVVTREDQDFEFLWGDDFAIEEGFLSVTSPFAGSSSVLHLLRTHIINLVEGRFCLAHEGVPALRKDPSRVLRLVDKSDNGWIF